MTGRKARGPYKGATEYSAGYDPVHAPGWRTLRAAILDRDRRICSYCGGLATTVDHVIPRSKGGKSIPENLVAACSPCNTSKGDRAWPRRHGPPGWTSTPVPVDDLVLDDGQAQPVLPDPPPDRTAEEVAAALAGVPLTGPSFADGGPWRGRTVEPRSGGYRHPTAKVYGETP